MDEARVQQTVERFADLELDLTRIVDDPLHVAAAVDHLEHRAPLVVQGDVAFSDLRSVALEDDIERRDLLFDQPPLVDTARAFEQQLAQAATTARAAASPRGTALPVREKGFLEKPLATGLLLAATLVVGLLSWQVAAGNLTVGNIAGALAVYVSYVIAWLAARRRA